MILSYYPGCTLKTKARQLDLYARASAQALGIALCELPEWQCCGAVYPNASDEIATRLSAVRALHAARELGQPLVTLCSACHHVLKRTNQDLVRDENFRTKANAYCGFDVPYAGETRVMHYLEMLRDLVGFETLKKKVVHPIGEKVGAYYGCLLLRPSADMQFDDPESPTIIEDFLSAIGAEPINYAMRNECCGAYVTLEDRNQAITQSRRVLCDAADAGARTLVTACPLCKYNLAAAKTEDLPETLYLTQLLAIALGLVDETGGLAHEQQQ